jgi:hypothetical protein
MEIDLGRTPSRARGWSLGVVALGVALALVDFVVLRGDRVDSATVPLGDDEAVPLLIEHAGQEHLVEITTRLRRGGETRGRSVDYWIEDPEGRVVAEESEIVTRKHRYVRFVPEAPGEYWISVEDESLFGTRRGSARVEVYVNDRRILGPRLGSILPF